MEPSITNNDDFFDIEDIFDYDEEYFDNDDLEEKQSRGSEESFYRSIEDY